MPLQGWSWLVGKLQNAMVWQRVWAKKFAGLKTFIMFTQ
jgi:hypothetical protein